MLNNGTFIANRYEIVGQVGTGGMSDVYKAKDHALGRYVAIKVLKSEFSEDTNFVSKFRTEAQSAAVLEHPNIVNIYDVGSENGIHYIVMEYVEGITLKTYIEKKGQLTYKEALSIAIQVGRGIQAAHAKNIVHRDIKPQNIIISTDGKVKVTDFGIARAVSENTIHSDVMGSVHYASPEQARNGYVSNRSDIYSLGIVMYEMVTGRVPFDGDSTVAVAIQHLQDEMDPPSKYAPNLPISLEKIIQKCTQKSPDRRYDSMESLLIDLRKALLNPNEDFVTLVPFSQDKTRVLTDDEVNEIKKKTEAVKQDEPEPEEDDMSEYDDDDDDMSEYDEDDDDAEEGRFLNSKMEKIVGIMRIVVAIIIVIIVVYILGSFFDVFHFGSKKNNSKNDTLVSEDVEESVVMIDLKGKTLDEAKTELKKLGLNVTEAGTEISDSYEKGQIIDQDVAKGETVKTGTTIKVTVSAGSEEENAKDVDVPDVTGKTAEAAMATLEDKNLTVSREFEFSNDVPSGQVIRQDPKAGKTFLHPGRQALISYENEVMGYLGEVHPAVADTYGIGTRAYVAVLDILNVVKHASFDRKYEGIAKFPAVNRDISMVVPKDIMVGQIEHMIAQRGGKILEHFELFDIYEGDQIEKGFKSVAYSLTFRSKEKTLEEAEINGAMNKILNGLEGMGIQLRK